MEKIILNKDNLTSAVQKTVETLEREGVAIFPSDTLYALGVNALSEEGVVRFFALKKRPADKPVPIFVKDVEMAHELAYINKNQESVLQELWPGPFTFVLQKKDAVSDRLSADTKKVGLRVPNSEFCSLLLEEFRNPITGSSANISGMEPDVDASKIVEQLGEHSTLPDLVVDIGALPPAEPSAVVDISENNPKIIRPSSVLDSGTIDWMTKILNG